MYGLSVNKNQEYYNLGCKSSGASAHQICLILQVPYGASLGDLIHQVTKEEGIKCESLQDLKGKMALFLPNDSNDASPLSDRYSYGPYGIPLDHVSSQAHDLN